MSKYNSPFDITNKIFTLVSDIAELAGSIKESAIFAKCPVLRRENRIKTVHGSLSIEQNTLTVEQVTAVLRGKRIIAPPGLTGAEPCMV